MNGIKSKTSQELYSRVNSHLIISDRPSEFLNEASKTEEFESYPFSLLLSLKTTGQNDKYHPEGSVWEHTMLVVDSAAARRGESRDPRVFMWAALLHDIGKPPTTRDSMGRITSYDHDRAGAELTRGFLSEFTDDTRFINSVTALVRYHMHILYVIKDLPYKDMEGLSRQADIREVALLGLCDRLGRGGADENYEKQQIRKFLEKSSHFSFEKEK